MVRDVSASWCELGRELSISSNRRIHLKQDTSLSNDTRLEMVLEFWINGETEPVTWQTLVEALEGIGQKGLANKVKSLKIRKRNSPNKTPDSKSKFKFRNEICLKPILH